MAESSIPVDLFNPGQVFACLGFLEAADVLCGDAEGGFDWSDETEIKFCLLADGDENPFEAVLEFLAGAQTKPVAPEGWRPKDDPDKKEEPADPKAKRRLEEKKKKLERELSEQEESKNFPSASPETSSALPIQIAKDKKRIVLGHWADGSSRNEFKLYAGNRSAFVIATAMLSGTFDEPKKGQNIGALKTKGIVQLWKERKADLIERPLDITVPMGGSFNFDPRGGWTAIDAGYSPNEHKHQVAASPVVEILAAWGLENARPDEFEPRKVRYAAWRLALPPVLARVALVGGIAAVPMKRFRFDLNLSGKNKLITIAEKEAKAKKTKLSEKGFADAPATFRKTKVAQYLDSSSPNPEARVLGGVLAKGLIERDITVNLVALRAINGADEEKTKDVRRYLLALTLIASTAEIDLFLREGCHLRYAADDCWNVIPRRGGTKSVDLSSENAQTTLLEYAREAVKPFSAGWPKELICKFDLEEAKKLLAKKTEDEEGAA
jgi:CRISPR-associated protein Csx14